MKKLFLICCLVSISAFALPALATIGSFKELINSVLIGSILKPLVPLLIGLGVVVFIYGVFLLMLSEGGEKKEEGKQYMLWGIIGIFVMVSVWGLVNILKETFQLENSPIQVKIDAPKLQ